MSVNIQQADKTLKKVADTTVVNKSTVIGALGYTPVTPTELSNSVSTAKTELTNSINTTKTEIQGSVDALENTTNNLQQQINNIKSSSFDGDYNSLINAPILNEADGTVKFADEAGNIIARIDNNGFETTDIIVDNIVAKSDKLEFADESGNFIARIDATGITTTNINATNVSTLQNEYNATVENLNNLENDYEKHIADINDDGEARETTLHINKNERDKWNAVAETLDINSEDNSVIITDDEGFKIFQIDDTGLTTTSINTTKEITAAGNISAPNITEMVADINKKINIPGEAIEGNLATFTADKQIADAGVTIKNTTLDAEGNNLPNEKVVADYIAAEIQEYNNNTIVPTYSTKTETKEKVEEIDSKLTAHINETDGSGKLHITAEERAAWNAKSEFSGDFSDLENNPIDIEENDYLAIVDKTGENIVAQIDDTGLTVTNVNILNKTATGTVEFNLTNKINSIEGELNEQLAAIENRYTKTETDTAIATAIAEVDHLKREIVEVLPETGEPDIIYMLKAETTEESTQDLYDEYMYIDGAWERLGSWQTDLNDYYTKSDVDNLEDELLAKIAEKVAIDQGTTNIGKSLIIDNTGKVTPGYPTKLNTARKIKLAGEVTGEANFDGSANIEIQTIVPELDYINAYEEAGAYVITDGEPDNNIIARFDSTGLATTDVDLKDLGSVKGKFEEVDKAINDRVTGPETVTENAVVLFNNTNGRLVKDSGKTIVNQITGTNNIPTDTAVKTYVDNAVNTAEGELSGIIGGLKNFSKITNGTNTLEADSNADTLTFTAGNNVTIDIAEDADKITISSEGVVNVEVKAKDGVTNANAVTEAKISEDKNTLTLIKGIEFATKENLDEHIENFDTHVDTYNTFKEDFDSKFNLSLENGSLEIIDDPTLVGEGKEHILARFDENGLETTAILAEKISITDLDHSITVDEGNFDFNGKIISNIGTPTKDDEATTKAYVDGKANELNAGKVSNETKITLNGDVKEVTKTLNGDITFGIEINDNSHKHDETTVPKLNDKLEISTFNAFETNEYNVFKGEITEEVSKKLPNDASITLSGDLSGSGSFSEGAVSITAEVKPNSHEHTIENVTGLQSELNAKVDDNEFTSHVAAFNEHTAAYDTFKTDFDNKFNLNTNENSLDITDGNYIVATFGSEGLTTSKITVEGTGAEDGLITSKMIGTQSLGVMTEGNTAGLVVNPTYILWSGENEELVSMQPDARGLNINGYNIVGLGEPEEDDDAATKGYVDESVNNINIPQEVIILNDEMNPPPDGTILWIDPDDTTQDVLLADVAISGDYNDLINLPDLTKKADLASPTFIGAPKAPTAATGTNTTQIATTQFVQTALEGITAKAVSYDNSITGINADNVQDALDILYDKLLPDLIITTEPGSALSLTDGVHTLTGTADSEGKATFSIPSLERWTVTSTLEEQISTEIIDILELTEEYHLTIEYFSASLTVTSPNGGQGALVTAICDGCKYEGTLDDTGSCTLTVRRQGTYTVRGKYEEAYSDSREIYIGTGSDTNPNYTTSITFITLSVTGDPNIMLTVTDGTTTLTRTSTGKDIFLLPNTGTWNVYGTLQGNTVGESITITGYGSYSKDLYYVATTFDGTSWSVIQAVTKAGRASSYWAVGNYKTFSMTDNNIAGGNTSYTWYATIMGFNHNATYEGTNTIHLRFTPSNQYSAYCIGHTTSTSAPSSNGTLYMNSSNTNEGGWNDSYMRNAICATFYSTNIPADLRAVLGPCTKYTDNAGLAKNSEDAVTATTDYIFLPSEFEMWGSRSYANIYEQNKQAQYSYFANGNAIALNNVLSNSTSSTSIPNTTNSNTAIDSNYHQYAIIWSRSAQYNNSTAFCISMVTRYSIDSYAHSRWLYSHKNSLNAATFYYKLTGYTNDYYMSTGIAPYGVIK